MRLRSCAALLLLALAVACRDTTAPEIVAELRPLDTAYVAIPLGDGGHYTVDVVLRLTNTGRTTLRLDGCGPGATSPIYFVTGGNDGSSAYNPAWACTGGGEGVRVRPGEVRVDSIRLHGSPRSRSDPAIGSFQGMMAVGYLMGRKSIVSSPFRVSLSAP
jgi:hypothetical protein